MSKLKIWYFSKRWLQLLILIAVIFLVHFAYDCIFFNVNSKNASGFKILNSSSNAFLYSDIRQHHSDSESISTPNSEIFISHGSTPNFIFTEENVPSNIKI